MSNRWSLLIQVLLIAALSLVLSLPSLAAGDQARGKELVNSSGCKGCHKIDGKGGTLGPDLDGVGKRLSAAEILKQLKNPKARNPSSMMPSFSYLPQKDLQALVNYLESLK
jgi:mono/diheme cytochrome c family protein